MINHRPSRAALRAGVVVGMALFSLAAAAGQTTQSSKPPQPRPTQEALDKAFAAQMDDVTLVGWFTTTGQDKPSENRYTIVKISKLEGDEWLFIARIQFGGKNVELPLTIPVKWAGDTPVISVSDIGIPSLGTYTARVMIYKDQFAGTWSGKEHGGLMWGRIEHNATSNQPTTQPAK